MKSYLFLVLLCVTVMTTTVFSQDLDEDFTVPKHQAGFVFSMAETGSGLGGFYAWPLMSDMHIGASLDAFFIRDSKQVDFYDPYYGTPISINKKNNVYLFDLLVTFKKRFFAGDVDESFRPFISAGVGPHFAMNFPEAKTDESGNLLGDQYAWTLGGFVGTGVDISVDSKMFVSIRAQYRVIPFAETVGETSNHSMFELRFEVGQRF